MVLEQLKPVHYITKLFLSLTVSLPLSLSISLGEHVVYIYYLVQPRALFVSPQRLTKDKELFIRVFLKGVIYENSANHIATFLLLCTCSQGERGSYTVQMWRYHLLGLKYDLCTFLAPISYELAERILLGVLSGSLSQLARRYSSSTPSHARLNQFR